VAAETRSALPLRALFGGSLALLALLGCNKGSTAEPSTSNVSKQPAVAASSASGSSKLEASGALTLSHLTLKNADGEALDLAADGRVTVSGDGREVGRIEPDGRFLGPDGKIRLLLARTGEVFSGDGRELPVTVNGDGVVHTAQGALSFGPDGVLGGGNPSAPKTTIEGLTRETRRTAALLLLVAAFPTR